MASLRKKDRSPFWFACFTLPDGSRTQRSTGTTHRRKAQRIAQEFEDAARAAGEGRFTEARARKVIADIYALGNPESTLTRSSAGDWLTAWLVRKELEAGTTTHEKYSSVIGQFKKHLGAKLARDISTITAGDITTFRDGLATRLSVGSVNLALKILRTAFAQARRDGLIDVNEAERVTALKREPGRLERRAFTLDELRLILAAASDEWRGMILFGLYTGQRLGDIATLTWQNVDLQRQELRLVTQKTKRQQIIPLAQPVIRYAEALPSSDHPETPLFPKAAGSVQRLGRTAHLSNQFYDLLVSAGLAKERTHQKKEGEEKGRGTKRELNAISFHSLRHTATSLLKNAGVSESVAMEFVGHESSSVSRNYTHIDTATLKDAAGKLPDITAIKLEAAK